MLMTGAFFLHRETNQLLMARITVSILFVATPGLSFRDSRRESRRQQTRGDCKPARALPSFPAVKLTRLAAIMFVVALAIGAAVAAGPMFAPECSLANGTNVVTVSNQ